MRRVPDLIRDPLYGEQEGRHCHGYYDCYCYLPLYVFCGRHLLAAKLRSSSVDAADGSVAEVARIVGQIRERWPATSIVIRADSGFCRDDLMSWCEANGVQYVLGLAGNSRLKARLAPEMRTAKRKSKRTGQPAREFADFAYRTRRSWSWSCKRRVIGKAEWTNGEANPRFIVTNVHPAFGAARFLYETVYCQRGEMENRLKECQGELFADRTPAPTLRANQLRLWLSSFAYILMCAVRRIGLAGTKLERATCGTIRLAWDRQRWRRAQWLALDRRRGLATLCRHRGAPPRQLKSLRHNNFHRGAAPMLLTCAEKFRGHKDRIQNVAFSTDGALIVTGSHDGTARVWRAFPDSQELVAFARARVPRCLTPKQRGSFSSIRCTDLAQSAGQVVLLTPRGLPPRSRHGSEPRKGVRPLSVMAVCTVR